MSRRSAEQFLPGHLLAKASLHGNEYAWKLEDIPLVVEAARCAGLISLGGQLQFRLPDGDTCECYWIDVDTGKTVPGTLPWHERVERTAEAGLRDFTALQMQFDFLAEGRKTFSAYFDKHTARSGDPLEAICFVWYVLDKGEAGAH